MAEGGEASKPKERVASTSVEQPATISDTTSVAANPSTSSTPMTMDRVASNSLDARIGGPAAGPSDAPTLSEGAYRRPDGSLAAPTINQHAIECSLAIGVPTVHTAAFTTRTASGEQRTVRGPVSHNQQGQQFVIDDRTHQRFRVIPAKPGDANPNGSLQSAGQLLTVVDKRPASHFDRGTHSDRQHDPNRPVERGPRATGREGPVVPVVQRVPGSDVLPARRPISPGGENRFHPPGTGTGERHGRGRPEGERCDEGNGRWPHRRREGAVPITARPTDGPPDTRPPGDRSRTRPEARPDVAPVARPDHAADRVRTQFDRETGIVRPVIGRPDGRPRDGQPDIRPPGDPNRARPEARPDVAPVARPDHAADRVRAQFDRETGIVRPVIGRPDGRLDGGPEARPDRHLDRQHRHEGNQDRDFRCQPPMNRDRIDELRRRVNENPSLLGRVERHEQHRGGEKPGDYGDNRVRGNLPPGERNRQIESTLAEILKNRDSRAGLTELVNGMHRGKNPTDGSQSRAVQDVIKALGPDGLAGLQRALADRDGLGRRGDTRSDVTLSPSVRALLDGLVTPVGRRQDGDLLSQRPGALVSERLLDVLRQTDKLNVQRVPGGDSMRSTMFEMGKIVRDLNIAHGLDVSRALTFRDIIGRSLPDGRSPLQQLSDRRDLVLRPQSADDAVSRTLLDRLNQNRTMETETRRSDLTMRTETLTPRLDARPEQKFEPRLEVKPESSAVRSEAVRDYSIKAEIAPAVRTDVPRSESVPGVRQDLVVDSESPVPIRTELPSMISATADQQYRLEEEEKSKQIKLREQKEQKEKEDQLPVDAAAALAALQARKRKEMEEKDKQEKAQEKDKKEPEKRQRYIVRRGDTLESIASKVLRDKRLAGLIYDINRQTIPVMMVEGKQVPNLQERMIIWLPTTTESKDYRSRIMTSEPPAAPKFEKAEDELVARFGHNWSGTADGGSIASGAALQGMEDSARTAYQSRRKNIENLLGPLSPRNDGGKQKYVVRLGESLKSIATKHPALQEVSLWRLVAEINGLPTKTDEKGAPIAKLSRGQSLIMPTVTEIESFKRREHVGVVRDKIGGPLEMPTRACSKCEHVTFASALLCPSCGVCFEEVGNVTAGAAAPAEINTDSEARTVPVLGETTQIIHEIESAELYSPFHSFCDTVRLTTAGRHEDLANGYKMRLELFESNTWIPLVSYEVFIGMCLRHEHLLGGQRKTIRIDLPPQSAIELASNDLRTHWETYRDRHQNSSNAASL